MSIAQIQAEDRRLIILRAMHEAVGYKLNETIVARSLDMFGYAASSDLVRAELAWLEEQGLVEIERLPRPGGEPFWVATLRNRGCEVAEGRARHPGVARRTPD